MPNSLSSVLYLPHGGGPLPLLGDKDHEFLTEFLTSIPNQLGNPSAILIISAHWEGDQATITSGPDPQLIFDYYGFPAETYQYKYDAPGHPELAEKIHQLIHLRGIESVLDDQCGFDHGMFVPLMLMYPDFQIPCVQLSLLNNLNPEDHIALGKSLARLRRQNILIIGSGLSFHNIKAFYDESTESRVKAESFDKWLVETCTNPKLSDQQRQQRLIEWESAPNARYCHPREEHLLPLHVCYGIASADTPNANLVFNNTVLGKKASGFLW